MKRLALVAIVFAQCGAAPDPRAPEGVVVPTFHGDRARTGWFSAETTLTPAGVARMRSLSRRTVRLPSLAAIQPRSYIMRPVPTMSSRSCCSQQGMVFIV